MNDATILKMNEDFENVNDIAYNIKRIFPKDWHLKKITIIVED